MDPCPAKRSNTHTHTEPYLCTMGWEEAKDETTASINLNSMTSKLRAHKHKNNGRLFYAAISTQTNTTHTHTNTARQTETHQILIPLRCSFFLALFCIYAFVLQIINFYDIHLFYLTKRKKNVYEFHAFNR